MIHAVALLALFQAKAPADDPVLAALKWLSRHQAADGSWGAPRSACDCVPASEPPRAAKRPPVDEARLASLVAKLASDDPEDREAATEAIATLGEAAAPAVEAAVTSSDAETSGRAKLLLHRLRPHKPDPRISATSLSLVAFLGAGYTNRSRDVHDGCNFGNTVRRGLQFLMSVQDADGFIGAGTEHSLATLALCEVYGLTASTVFKEQAQKAVDALVSVQKRDGGWSRAPSGASDSLSTAWAVMALKSAELGDLAGPRGAYEKVREWFQAVTGKDGRAGMAAKGDWDGKQKDIATPCTMLMRIFIERNKQDPSLAQGAKLVSNDLASSKDEDVTFRYFAGLALFQFDGPSGASWKQGWKTHREAVLPTQRSGKECVRGSWAGAGSWSVVESTALHALSLEFYHR